MPYLFILIVLVGGLIYFLYLLYWTVYSILNIILFFKEGDPIEKDTNIYIITVIGLTLFIIYRKEILDYLF